MARSIGPVAPNSPKTYGSESLMTRGYAVASGLLDGNATAIITAGQRALGILEEDVLAVGRGAKVNRFGDSVGIAGAPVPYGSYVKADAAGRLVPIAGTAGEEVVGRAESTASGLGDEVLVFVLPSVR